MIPIRFEDWGFIPYGLALDQQKSFQSQLVDYKLRLRNGLIHSHDQKPNQYLIFCEHNPVYTLGNRADKSHLLLSEEELKRNGIEVFSIRRGGDITFHGPGQLVGYPILDLEDFFTDIHQYLRYLEEIIIQTLSEFGILAGRINGLSGVWIEPDIPARSRKICALGVHCSRWVTMHGFALNINTQLDYFKDIIPCGIEDRGISSIAMELGRPVDIGEVKKILKEKFAGQFGIFWT